MTEFRFELKLPTGDTIRSEAVAERWQWSYAFGRACQVAERRYGLPPFSGIRCVAYETGPTTEPEH